MKKEIHYCDYCGVEITKKNHIRKIRTVWERWDTFFFPYGEATIGGDGCIDCYKSYVKWSKSRQTHKRVKR